ncbi:hypothetical protein GSI_08551 [Ganoderma sinense ZZ0214-1]|uniref:Uncharacterized protein n=1 Tax=Ganoderma sinense ZZ0214-1 TaxID=1077348 RepID=A0A2G8S401_9APHY|nr:hypothetical protein GSI_08551 [Ganoderma sinense ZZ0214-1]
MSSFNWLTTITTTGTALGDHVFTLTLITPAQTVVSGEISVGYTVTVPNFGIPNPTESPSTVPTSTSSVLSSSTSTDRSTTSAPGAPPASISQSLETSTPPSTTTSFPTTSVSIPSTPSVPSSISAPSSGLSAGSAVGIALGVFAVASVTAVAGVFLFLQKRKRHRNRSLKSAHYPKRETKPSEGMARSPSLSQTWSWLGSLAVGSEPEPEWNHGLGASLPHPRDDTCPSSSSSPRTGTETGTGTGARTGTPGMEKSSVVDKSDPSTNQIVPPVAFYVDHTLVRIPQPPLPVKHSGGGERLLALAPTGYTHSLLPLYSSQAGQRDVEASEGPWYELETDGDGIRPRASFDPFADPASL